MTPAEKQTKQLDQEIKKTYHSKKEASVVESSKESSEVTASITSTATTIKKTAQTIKAVQK